MPEVNRKKVRAMAAELAQAPEGEILERFKSSMTTSEFEALQRVCRDRGIAVPAEHGEITPEPDLPQRIISAEELAGVDVAQVKKPHPSAGVRAFRFLPVSAWLSASGRATSGLRFSTAS